jgi:hypothetical protein
VSSDGDSLCQVPSDGVNAAEEFSWIRASAPGDAGCVTLVHSADRAAVARAFGGDPSGARRRALADAENLALDIDADELIESQWLAVRSLGPWTLVVEVNGWQGSRPEVLERVCAGTRAVSAYWNVNGGTRFCYASEGRVLVAFDALFPDRREGADPDCLEGLRAGLWPDDPDEDEDADEVAMMLALAARVTGLAPVPEWLEGEFDVIPVEPLAEAVRSAIDPDLEPLTYNDPPLAWALRHAAAQPLRAAAQAAARFAVGAAGIEDRPHVALALRFDVPAKAAELEPLLAGFDRAARKSAGDPRPAGCYWAVTALREAANPQPLAAAFRAVSAARSTAQGFGVAESRLREEVLSVLGHPRPPAGSMGLVASPGPLPIDSYAWTSAHWLATAGAITFVQGSAADAARALGPGPDGAEVGVPMLFSDPVAAIREEDGWAVAVENHERLGPFARYENLPSKTVTVTWSARGRALLHYSDSGRLLVMLDPQDPGQASDGDLAVLDAHLGGLRLGPTGAGAAACLPLLLVLAQRLTGVRFEPARLDRPHLLVPRPRWLGGSRLPGIG